LYYCYEERELREKLMSFIFPNHNLAKLKCRHSILKKNIMLFPEFNKRLLELSDINLQRKLWLNIDDNTGLMSSYSELYNSLLGDFDFDYEIKYIDDSILKQNLLKLKEMLEKYKEPSSYEKCYDDIILNDPNWHNIVLFAKRLVSIKTAE
jgi:hypothetical protein